jgi:cytochrome c-type biogenesis protein CcmE
MANVERVPHLGAKIAASVVLIGMCVTLPHLAPAPRPEYKMVDELVEHASDFEGRAVRAHGYVEAGSIVALAPDVHEYVLEKSGIKLRVRHAGVLPDTFHDQSEVVQDGRLILTWRGYELDGDTMHTKCGGKYEGASPRQTAKFE